MTTKFLLSSDDNTRSGLLKKKIIHYYMANGDATIAEVCKEMNLSIPTVTKLISELQEDGYILDFGKQETSGGRKPSIYGLNPVSGYFVGVDILKDQLNLAILDFKGDKIRIEQNIPYTLENTPAALDHLCECINEFINSLPIPREKILSIGINGCYSRTSLFGSFFFISPRRAYRVGRQRTGSLPYSLKISRWICPRPVRYLHSRSLSLPL